MEAAANELLGEGSKGVDALRELAANTTAWNIDPATITKIKAKINTPEDCWWPCIGQGKNKRVCSELYRVMRLDLRDLQPVKFREPRNHDELCHVVMGALVDGSKEGKTSPFWHTSKSIHESQSWLAMSGGRQGEAPPEGYMHVCIMIHIWDWCQTGKMPAGAIIDLSDQAAWNSFFKKPFKDLGISDTWANLGRKYALEAQEVLIKYRGEVPIEHCSVVDIRSGVDCGPLQLLLDHVKQMGGSLVKQIGEPKYCEVNPRNVFETRVTNPQIGESTTVSQPAEMTQTKVQKVLETRPTPKKAPKPREAAPHEKGTEQCVVAPRPTRPCPRNVATQNATDKIAPPENKSQSKAAADASHPQPSENHAVEAVNASLAQEDTGKMSQADTAMDNRQRTGSQKPSMLHPSVPSAVDAANALVVQKGSGKRSNASTSMGLTPKSQMQREVYQDKCSQKLSTQPNLPPKHDPIVLGFIPVDLDDEDGDLPESKPIKKKAKVLPSVPVFHAPPEASSSASGGSQPSKPDSSTQPSLAQSDVQSGQILNKTEQAVVIKFINDKVTRHFECMKEKLPSHLFEILEKIHALEIAHTAKIRKITNAMYDEHETRLTRVGLSDVVGDDGLAKGFDRDKIKHLRQLKVVLRGNLQFTQFRSWSKELLETQGKALIDLGVLHVLHLLSDSTTTKRAVQAALAKWPDLDTIASLSRIPVTVSYFKILSDMGIINAPVGFRGRKPSAGTSEQQMTSQESWWGKGGVYWGTWWMSLASFQATLHPTTPYPPPPSPTSSIPQPFPYPDSHPSISSPAPSHTHRCAVQCILYVLYIQYIQHILYILYIQYIQYIVYMPYTLYMLYILINCTYCTYCAYCTYRSFLYIQCSTYCTYSTIHFIHTIQYSTYNTVHTVVHASTAQYRVSSEYSTLSSNHVVLCTVQFNTVQYSTVQ